MGIKLKNTSEYEKMSLEDSFAFLESSKDGLSDKEANNRIDIYGYNEIIEKKQNHFIDFINRYWGPMPWLLELAIVLTVVLNHYSESIIIFILLSINAVIGYVQSQNSQKAVELLKKKLEIKAKIFRDKKITLKEAKYIVPGDVIVLKIGDIVPADAVIFDGNISVDESAITGESLVKEIQQSNVVYSSSIVKSGSAICLVVNTAKNTYFGKTVELVKIAKPKSKQEELMFNIVKYMMYVGIVASIIVSIYAIYLNKSFLIILSFIVTFLIGAIPVALPAVLTIIQAVGAIQLSKKGVLVTKLASLEDAAAIDVFCFDKTGTITQNKLSIVDIIPYGEYSKEDVIKIAASASNSQEMDIIDLAIKEYYNTTLSNTELYEQIAYVPFDPKSKKTEATLKINNSNFKVIKGASQIILNLCKNIDKEIYEKINAKIEEISNKGCRLIAIAVSNNNEYNFAGLISMSDPPRQDSKDLIYEIKNLGIKTIMLTGDSLDIAREVAKQVEIGNNIIKASDLYKLKEAEQLKLIEESDGFAEVYPEDKYNIVKLLQNNGHMVGMTGDGVNDAPALKQAQLGVAVSESTDVAKSSASIVLTVPGLSGIIQAVDISRQTYQKMLTWVLNKITKVIEFVILLTIGFFWLHDIVVSLLGISLLVFVNDFLTMSIATDNVKSTKTPNKWNIKNITIASLLLGTLFAIGDLIILYVGINYFNLDFSRLQTLVILSLIFNSQFRILILRERKHFYASTPSIGIRVICVSTILAFILMGMFGMIIPNIQINQIIIVLCFSMLFTLLIDYIKVYIFKKLKI